MITVVAAASERAANKSLVRPVAVGVGGVEEGHAPVEGFVDRGQSLTLAGCTVEAGHPDAAEPDLGHDRP